MTSSLLLALNQSNKLIGKWKYAKSWSKIIGEPSSSKRWSADTIKYFEFLDNGKVAGNYFDGVKYRADSATISIFSTQNIITERYRYYLYKDTLRLDLGCDEGCGIVFVKIH